MWTCRPSRGQQTDLRACALAAVVPTEAVRGLGGIGRTDPVTEYAHRFGSDYDITWWIRCGGQHEDRFVGVLDDLDDHVRGATVRDDAIPEFAQSVDRS